jgi:hypothetical protein
LRARATLGAAVVATLVALSSGCGGAYTEAIARGDKLAAAGMWDEAAAAYAQAQKIDPVDPEAQIKLKAVRRKQASERLTKGKSLIARGELEKGLVALQDAAQLDPDNTEAQAALADANAEALHEAERLMDKGDLQHAFELTTLVLKGSPRDPRAKRVDAKVREALADASYARADDFQKRGKLGNALLEYAACLDYIPDYRDAKLRVGQAKLALEQEITYYVVLGRFEDQTGPKDLARALTVDLLSQSFDPKLPLRVVAAAPDKGNPRGVRLTGRFENYRFEHGQDRLEKSCDYECGKEQQPNPDYEPAVQRVKNEEEQEARAQRDVDDAQKDFDRYQREVADLQKDVDRYRDEVDQRRKTLDECRDRHKNDNPPSSSSCSSEESSLKSSESSLDSASQRMYFPKQNLESAQNKLSDRRRTLESARQEATDARAHLRDTPPMKWVVRMCPHNYQISVHTLTAEVTVRMTAEQIHDKTKLLDDQAFPYRSGARDETFAAQPNRCPEVAAGDPLQLPSEKELKLDLVTSSIKGVRDKVMGAYERNRQRYLADARREEAAGVSEEAVEAYVRYVLTGPKSIDAKDGQQIAEFLRKTRGFGKLDALPGL